MKCESCITLIDVYFDGELDVESTEAVEKHLDSCGECSTALLRLEREQEVFLKYECNTQASQGFWDNVMARARGPIDTGKIQARHQPLPAIRFGEFKSWRLSPAIAALLVLSSIAITVAVMRYKGPSETSRDELSPPSVKPAIAGELTAPEKQVTDETPIVAPPSVVSIGKRDKATVLARRKNGAANTRTIPAADREAEPEALVREAEQKYVAAITILSRDAGRRRSRLDPDAAARFEKTLTAVDRTIADTRRAVRRHPGDPLAAKYMLTAYSRKIDVLRAMIDY